MSEFLMQLAGAVVGCVVVSVALLVLLSMITDTESLAPTRGDAVIGWIVGVLVIAALTVATGELYPGASLFEQQLGFGAGIGVVVNGGQLLACIRGHRRRPDTVTGAGACSDPRPCVQLALSRDVQRHFTGSRAQARELIAGYRVEMIQSPAVPHRAAEILADLPGAGQAWAELSMASDDSPRSELLPIMDRAAAEIGYSRTASESEADVLESAAYRAVVDGRVVEESYRFYGVDFDYEHPAELEQLRTAWYLSEGAGEPLSRVRAELAGYLNARYG